MQGTVKPMWSRTKHSTSEWLRRWNIKKKGKALVTQVRRDHQVWSSGDEYDESQNKRKRGKMCLVAIDEDGSANLKKNYCYMAKERTLNIVEHVKIRIQSNNDNMHECDRHLDRLTQTCDNVLIDYNKGLDKKNVATQELYHLRGRLEDKNIKVTMLERNLLLEKYARLLCET